MKHPIWDYIFSPPMERKTLLELLHSSPVFEGLTTNELNQISRVLHERTYHREESVFSEGDPGAGMYIIKKGQVAITRRGGGTERIRLATIGEREFFGEMALLDEIPRSASCTALQDSILLGFCKPDLEKLNERNPRLGIKIIGNLSRLISRPTFRTF